MTQTTVAPTFEVEEEDYVLTWENDEQYFTDAIGEILADPSYDDEGLDELKAHYKENGFINTGDLNSLALTCFLNMEDEIDRRLEPTAEMLNMESITCEEYREACQDSIEMHLDCLITWDSL